MTQNWPKVKSRGRFRQGNLIGRSVGPRNGEIRNTLAAEYGFMNAVMNRSGGAGGGKYAGSRSTPTIDGDHLYVLSDLGKVVCLKTSDGKEA